METLLNNDPKRDKMINSRVMSPKTNFSFSSFIMAFKPKTYLLFQYEPYNLAKIWLIIMVL